MPVRRRHARGGAEFVGIDAQGGPPVEAGLDPEIVPLPAVVGVAEEFHFHLLKFARAEDEVARGDFVAEGLADLGDAEGDLDPHGIEDVLVVQEDALGGFRPEVGHVVLAGGGAHEGLEHQVEAARFGQLAVAVLARVLAGLSGAVHFARRDRPGTGPCRPCSRPWGR